MTKTSAPAFGEADLSNCEREQIHLAGSIQPHGALLVLDDAAEIVLQCSANAGAFLGLGEAPLVGRRLASLPGTLAARVARRAVAAGQVEAEARRAAEMGLQRGRPTSCLFAEAGRGWRPP
ncbi:MAG: hypothetical protein OTI36_19615 [Beijerinckiaceae bacterium]|nr:hypothetical protein [Beijerinckiaceae bacterium]